MLSKFILFTNWWLASCLINNIKIYMNIYIKTVPTCFVAVIVVKIVHWNSSVCGQHGGGVAAYTGSSKKIDGIWNRYNLKTTRRIYTFCILKCSENFNILGLP